MKNCTRCCCTKETSSFSVDRQKSDGLRNWCRACVRDHRRTNAESIKVSRARYATDNRDLLIQKSREYHEANRDSILTRKRDYDANNKGRIATRTAEYYSLKPEKKWVNTYQNRAREYGLAPVIVDDFTKRDVIQAYGDSCYYCPDGSFDELDHSVPIAAGGVHSLANVRPSCSHCNNSKSQADKSAAAAFRHIRPTNPDCPEHGTESDNK